MTCLLQKKMVIIKESQDQESTKESQDQESTKENIKDLEKLTKFK